MEMDVVRVLGSQMSPQRDQKLLLCPGRAEAFGNTSLFELLVAPRLDALQTHLFTLSHSKRKPLSSFPDVRDEPNTDQFIESNQTADRLEMCILFRT